MIHEGGQDKMKRKKFSSLVKKGASVSLAAVFLTATAAPTMSAAVYAQENDLATTVAAESTLPEEVNTLETPKNTVVASNQSDVSVQQDVIYPEVIYLNKTSQSLVQGATFQLSISGYSGNATNKEVTWESGDSAVVTVDENGLVTAVGAGTAVVTATSVGKNEGMDAPASASCTFNVDGVDGVYEYEVSGNTVTITGYNGDGGDVVIPATIAGKSVTKLGKMSFWMDDNITSVVIPEGVTYIDEAAFNGCSNLKSVTLPSTLRTIYHEAFRMSGLEKVNIPEGVTYIGTEAFNGCDSLTEVTLPSTLTTITANAFGRCDAMAQEGRSITLPDNISYLGTNAFGSSSQQIQLYVAKGTTTLNTLKSKSTQIKYTASDRYPQSVTLNKSELELVNGNEETLTAEAVGESMNNDLVWSSDNEDAVTVDENGTVTAVGEGTAVVTVSAAGANEGQEAPASASCTVKVVNKEGSYLYTTNETGVTIERYTGGVMMLTVPDEIADKSVTAVADGAFSNGKYIGDLTLPDTITSVGENSFEDVTNVVARKGSDTAKALDEAGIDYLAKITVAMTTEFYNRDGSLSDTKGGTSTYTRREGSTINMSTATYNRGWVLESENVTGITDTNDALYKVEGTAGQEDITIKYVWREDNLGPDGEADKIPDQYQMNVSFSVTNGTWDDGLAETLDKFVTIRDENGVPAAEGSIEADLPAVGNAPAEGYEAGSWTPDVTSNLTVADEGTNFVYSYAEKKPVVDPENPDQDKPDQEKPNDRNDQNTDNDNDPADSEKDEDVVQTGDETPIGAAAAVLLLSGGALIGMETLRRRKNN